jgi:hypothetical protein
MSSRPRCHYLLLRPDAAPGLCRAVRWRILHLMRQLMNLPPSSSTRIVPLGNTNDGTNPLGPHAVFPVRPCRHLASRTPPGQHDLTGTSR